MTKQWISGVLGLIVIVAPFLALSETTLTWTLVVIGAVIALSNFWGMIAAPTGRRHEDTKSHA